MSKLTEQPIWQVLQHHQQKMAGQDLSTLFSQSSQRFAEFSLAVDNLFIDYSKQLITSETVQLLLELAEVQQLSQKRAALFNGELVNQTEQRAAMHMALRAPANAEYHVAGENIMPQLQAVTERWHLLANNLHQQQLFGVNKTPITDIIHVGIGGSDLGPRLLYQALQDYCNQSCRYHFISDQNAPTIEHLLATLNRTTTLVIVVSKSFTTVETLTRAQQIMQWLKQADKSDIIQQQVFAVTANQAAATAFGISDEHIFPLWDWVGGRYSICSIASLTAMLALGQQHFTEFLQGAYAMDQHFLHAELAHNAPIILGLLSIWYRQCWQWQSQVIIPYHSQLQLLPGYLQQLFMESLGKSVTTQQQPVDYPTGQIIWGAAGAHAQHSFMQLLQQGNTLAAIDFVLPIGTAEDDYAISNCLAQSTVLWQGVSQTEVYRQLAGNRPSTTILLSRLTPYNLGLLIALYEHQVFVQSAIWDINPFDQWGVEHGKQLAKQIQTDASEKPALLAKIQELLHS